MLFKQDILKLHPTENGKVQKNLKIQLIQFFLITSMHSSSVDSSKLFGKRIKLVL